MDAVVFKSCEVLFEIPARTDCEFFEASELPCFRFGDFFDWPSQFVAFLAFGDSVISSLEAEQLSSS